MPGIVGLITNKPRHWAEPQLRHMLASIRHERFYETGMSVDESLGMYVGWTARKGSFCERMPLCNGRGDVALVFSGEEFPEPERARRLTAARGPVDNGRPTYLVPLYEQDQSFPAALNGRFHGLLVDRNRGTIVLFNDRYGMHRLYYHQSEDAFYFSVEAKAILAVRPETRTADLTALSEFVSCGCVLENRTLFTDIHVLPCASKWIFRHGATPEKTHYFRPEEWEQQPPLEPEPYYRALRDVFSRNLPRYFDGRERIAMSLTGGLDTRTIMAWHNAPPGSLPCYTFGGMFRDCHDVRVAREVSRACAQPHQVIAVAGDFLERFPNYAERTVYLTDGCADVSRSADLYVNEQAREIAPIRMTGNYGTEVLRGIRSFKSTAQVAGFDAGLAPHLRQAQTTYAKILGEHPLSFAVFRQAPWHHFGLLALEQTQLSVRAPYLDNDLVRTVFRAPRSTFETDEVRLRLISDGSERLRQIPTDRGLGGDRGRLASAASRTHREFSFKAEYAYDYGMPQWLARLDHLASPLRLERLFLGRHKFNHYRVWYRDALAGYVKDVLLDSRALSRPYVDRRAVRAVVDGHVRGDQNFTTAIHKLLTLELVHRFLIDRQPIRSEITMRPGSTP